MGPCDKPTISFPAGSTVRDDSRLSVSFTHLTPSTWVDVLTDGTKIGTVHTNATGSGNQDVPITYQTASGAHLLRIAGPDGRFVEKVFTVRSKTLPFSNAITRDVTATASSEASNETTPNGRAAAAVDGDPNTFWHSRWEAPAATYPHTLTVDLGRKYALSAMKWVSRRGNPNGRVKTLVLEFSSDGSQWGGKQPVTLPYSSYPTIIGLPRRADARYVRITMTSPHDASQPFAAVGEVTFAGLADGHADRPRHDPTAHMWTPPAHCSLPNPTPPGQPAMASTDSSTAASTGTTNHSQTGTRPTRLPATGR
ncbi:F5/8 type C domain protein [Cutibacterium modestum HL037PA3]|nr:F5/8 type C domain protein [Cutibacterium modestum HL037PA3]